MSKTPGSITYDIDDGGLAILVVTTNVNTPTTPSGWTVQGANKALGLISDYMMYTRIATSDETGTTVTPMMDGDGTGRGFSKVWVYNEAAASGRIMSSLANHGGLAGLGGLAGKGGGLAG